MYVCMCNSNVYTFVVALHNGPCFSEKALLIHIIMTKLELLIHEVFAKVQNNSLAYCSK